MAAKASLQKFKMMNSCKDENNETIFFSKSFLLLFVNKIMFTKCFFSAPKVLFVWKMGAFFAKNVLFFLGRVLFLSAFFCQCPLRSLS